ncbi:MAG: acetamidase/formamidase family protein [Granulosicoccus sp.]
MTCNHTIHKNNHHFGWDNSIEPLLSVQPGKTVAVETIDSSGGQLSATATLSDLEKLDFEKVNPVTGPIYIEGAEPGDVVVISFLEFHPSGWGWTANIPGFGLLSNEFPDAALNIWNYETDLSMPAAFNTCGAVPLKPFVGTIGLAPKELGPHSVVPPRRVGGNMDIRDNCQGSKLYLPVEVDGGLLSLGDTHAAQGDGEICGTAIESPMDVEIKLELIKAADQRLPRLETFGPVTRHNDSKGYRITTGIGPDLMECAKDAVREMIDWITAETKISAVDAYMLASVAGDLRISEIVDIPNWVVSFYFPKAVFE